MKLKNRTALITGASRGIGRAIASAFAAEGSNLVITARSGSDLHSLQAEIKKHRVDCFVIEADLSEEKGVELIRKTVQREKIKIDLLVNNAGIGSAIAAKPVADFDDDIWDKTIFINLKIPYLMSKMVLPGMLKQQYGRIINIASLAGKAGLLHGCAYSASKHGLLGLTRTLAMEVVKDGITVNAICPGAVKTATNEPRKSYDAKRLNISLEQMEKMMTPLGRRLLAEEIAPLAVYLASDEACVVTGQAYNIDGGALMC